MQSVSFNESRLPHLTRWYKHVSSLKSTYPKFDYLGNAILTGAVLAPGGRAAASGEAGPEQEPAANKAADLKKVDARKKDVMPQEGEAPRSEIASQDDRTATDPANDWLW